jgi:hypothetical protein
LVNSSKNIELVCDNGSLHISPDDRGWSYVVLRYQNRDVILGSEEFQYIVDHLILFLTGEKFTSLEWVLSLSEMHYSFYGEHKEGGAILKIQDHNAKWIADLKLTNKQRHEWKIILSTIKAQSKGAG